jgi:hypothetical protein
VPATRPSARAAVLRGALLFTPFLGVTLVALVLIARDTADTGASAGRIVGLVLVGSVALLLTYQVVQSVRDLFSSPVETIGLVERRWSRNDLFLFRNSYIFVGRDVFRLAPEEFIEVDLGDTVRIVHYPHTTTVEEIEVVERRAEKKQQKHV